MLVLVQVGVVRVARERGVSSYVGDGAGVWPALHVTDAARLVRLALEKAPVGAAVHALGWIGMFFAGDFPVTNDRTRELLGWAERPDPARGPRGRPLHRLNVAGYGTRTE